ncbi:tRNA (32-2'-O)-methyltransferase regulator THADA [Lycorma delicatula]|uniref:tRNA (32-2'-O)-methyltransferase regulator THADA n=1 Tax=Lycorma delicatula TaxID=130591 RepID=UPI003F5154D0
MENLSKVFDAITEIQNTLNVAINDGEVYYIEVDIFKDLMNHFRKLNAIPKNDLLIHEKQISTINHSILNLLIGLKLRFECQIVASKTLCAGYILLYDLPSAIKKIMSVLKNEKSTKSIKNIFHNNSVITENVTNQNVFNVCMCFALMELSFKVWSSCDDININNVFVEIFPILEKTSYSYLSETLLSFKCLVKMFELLNLLSKSNFIESDNYILRVMNIVMSNMENPLTGVREQTGLLFNIFLALTNKMQWINTINKQMIINKNLFNCNPVMYVIFTQQTWMMKSKYYLLSYSIQKKNTSEWSYYKDDLMNGLKISLQYAYLAPAGSDLYEACIKQIGLNKWKEMFLPLFIEVLTSSENNLMKQNIINYWMQSTLKIGSHIFNVIYDNLSSSDNVDSFIYLLKIGRREGFITNLTESQFNKLKIGLIHSDEIIRSNAFSSICVVKVLIAVITVEEINLIKQFLIENINYDSSRLRQSLMHSCTTLFIRIRDSFLFKLRSNKKNESLLYKDNSLLDVGDFISWIYTFLINNLEKGCNYQRKYTSLLLYEMILNYIGCSSKHFLQRKSNNKSEGVKVKEFIERLNKWHFTSSKSKNVLFSCIMDPSETIRNIAVNILSNYFTLNDDNIDELLSFYKKGIDLCSDKMFYQAESGALLLKTVTILAYKSKSDNEKNRFLLKLLNSEKFILNSLLNIAEKQKNELLKDILQAASNGSPLHGILLAIEELLTDNKSPEFGCFNLDNIEKLILLMEVINNKLLTALSSSSEKITDFAPSFADMGESIISIAHQSKIFNEFGNNDDGDEEIQLSSAYQLILNCIWLNIKTCCSLSSKLITTSLLDVNINFINRCVELIVNVLRKCRHKGAIETAGIAILDVTKYLTSHKNVKYQQIPVNILKEIFKTIIISSNGTISRKSAGLSILVHRIVAGDCNKKKPLLHSCVIELMNIASEDVNDTYDELTDLPQSRALHLLCRLVQDSALRQEISHHIHDVSVLCFNRFSSNIWSIRNAALQLFGAVLPKLIGEKKHQESEDGCENYTVAFEELYFHVETLFHLIDKQLSSIVNKNDFIEHSKLMPTLTLLSNLTVTMHTCINNNLNNIINKFNQYLEILLSSPLYTIRQLSAKINCNFCLPHKLRDIIGTRIHQITTEFDNNKTVNSNKIHGLLLNTKYLLAKYYKLLESMQYLKQFENDLIFSVKKLNLIKRNNLSYIIKTLLSDILNNYDNNINITNRYNYLIKSINNKNKILSNYIGFSSWCNVEINLIILKCNLDDLKNYVNIFLFNYTSCDINIYCLKSLKLRIENVTVDDDKDFYHYFINILIDFIIDRNKIEVLSVAFEVVLAFIKQLKIIHNTDNYINKINIIYNRYLIDCKYCIKCTRLALPVICSFISDKFSFDFIKNTINFIFKWSKPVTHDEDLRLSSVTSLIQLIQYLKMKKHNDEIGIIVWKSLCNFLQDENNDVRIEITRFFTKFYSDKIIFINNIQTINPYVSLCKIYKIDTMSGLMSEESAIKCLWNLLDVNNKESLENYYALDNANPFNHGLNNIYEEDVKIIDIVFNELHQFILQNSYKSNLIKIITNESHCTSCILKNHSDNNISNYLKQKKKQYTKRILALL